MKIIARNPNTKVATTIVTLPGYFGVNQDGIKFADDPTVFPVEAVDLWRVVIPDCPEPTLSTEKEKPKEYGENTENQPQRDPTTGKFLPGNKLGKFGGRKKDLFADALKEIVETKTYEKKGVGRIEAIKIMAERVIDEIALKGNTKMLEIYLDRTEGKVTQGVHLTGAIAREPMTDEEYAELQKIFPNHEEGKL